MRRYSRTRAGGNTGFRCAHGDVRAGGAASRGQRPLAAVVTDLHMPRIDGYELIQRLRAEPRFAAVPIVVISGDTDLETPGRLRRLGADAFFAKPFSPNAVRQTLEHLLYAK